MRGYWLCVGLVAVVLAGCAGGGGYKGDDGQRSTSKEGKGRYAMDRDAYPDLPPDVSDVPDAVPRVEPLARSGNRPTYEVWGKTYHVLSDANGYEKSGRASWYGEKFHGYATASGEIYDMYKMTAAHRSLPLPTYARVTNLDNNRSVIVKVNDRGPFHDDRLIDLSYAAAARLDILRNGTGRVSVEAIDPVAWQAKQRKVRQAQEPESSTKHLAAQVASSPAAEGGDVRAQAAMSAPGPSATVAKTASTPEEASVSDTGEVLYLQVAALGSAANAQALRDRLQSELDSPVRVDSDESLHRVQVGPVSDRLALETLRSKLRRVGYAQSFTITSSD